MVSVDGSSRSRRPQSARTRRAGELVGQRLLTWRKLQGLTAEQVAQRANISRPTLRSLEHGATTVSLQTFLDVARALGQLDRVVDALDPYDTELGRAHADVKLPQRVRR